MEPSLKFKRSAHHTINGFAYQFDKSVIEILAADDSVPVTLEGIEDIDFGQDSIQCKYHATQKYTRSKIQEPILAFLEHYTSNDTRLTRRYKLYAFFNDVSSYRPIDLNELKLILGDKAAAFALSDDDLSKFLDDHFIFEHALDFDKQWFYATERITEALSCTPDECYLYYYKSALYEVIRLSRQADAKDRTTTRSEFLSVINKKHILSSIWLSQLATQHDYAAHIKSSLQQQQALKPTRRKVLFLNDRLLSRMGESGFIVLCQALIERYYHLGFTLHSSLPFTLILDASSTTIAKLKLALLEQQIVFNDGHEYLGFQSWLFNAPPITNACTVGRNRPNDKICAASYVLKIISRTTFEQYKDYIEIPETFISTGPVCDSPTPHPKCYRHFHITEVESHALLIRVLVA